jgi:hypothetical protein
VLQPGPVTPVVVQIVEEPTTEVSVADILVGAFGFVGAVLVAAALVGLVAGGLFILFRRWRGASPADVSGGTALRLASPTQPERAGPPLTR